MSDLKTIDGRAATAVAPPQSRREAGKNERRRRIIDAARDLIRETGDAGLSMRLLAARAGVSLATPYNLFGSRKAIVLAVLQDVREYQQRFAALRSTDPIERIFAALDLALEYYKNDPRFYKALWGAIFNSTDDVRTGLLNPHRSAFWEGLIGDAIAAGAITRDISPALMHQQLDFILRAAMHSWVVGEIDQDRLTPTAFCGFAMLLSGASTPAWRAPLQARLADSLARLAPPRPTPSPERVLAAG